MKRKLFSLLGTTVIGLSFATGALAATIVGGQEVKQAVPNVLLVRIPAAQDVVPSPQTMTGQQHVEIMMLNVNDSSAVDKDGHLDLSQFTQLVDQQIAVAQNQGVQGQALVLQSNPTANPDTPAQVQDLFQSMDSQSGSRSLVDRPYWYYYNSYYPYYGVYGYGYLPYYGYYGNSYYYPNYGVYFNGYTYPYSPVGYPYWYGGYYYYPYYHRW